MKKIIIFIIVAALVLIGAGVGAFVYFNSPEYVMGKAIGGAAEDLLEREEIKPIFKVVKEGSVEFSVGGFENREDIEIAGKAYFSKDAFMLDDFKLALDAENKIDGEIYIDKEKVYVKNDSILGGAYGAEIGELAESFEDSIFANGSGSEYALDKSTYDDIMNILELCDDTERLDDLIKDGKKLVDRYGKKLWKNICEYGEIESETDKVRVSKERVSARIVTLKLDGDAMAEVLEEMYDYACDDKKLYKFIEELSDICGPTSVDAYGNEKTLIELFEDKFIDDEDDTVKNAIDAVEDSDVELEISAVTPKLSTKLMKLSAVIERNGSTTEIELDLGKKGIKKTEKISLTIDDDDIVYEIKENDRKVYEAVLEVENEEIFSIEIDKKNDSYTLELPIADIVCEGDFEVDGKQTRITVESIQRKVALEDGGTETITCDIEVILKQKDEMPKPQNNISDISDIKAEDVDVWAERFSDMFTNKSGKIPTDAGELISNLTGADSYASYIEYTDEGLLFEEYCAENGIYGLKCAVSGVSLNEGLCFEAYYFENDDYATEHLNDIYSVMSFTGYAVYRQDNIVYSGTPEALDRAMGKS